MKQTEWFKREFPPITDNGLFPSIMERLEGTAARLHRKFTYQKGHWATPKADKWSINKEIGHLIDLEPLWHERILQIIGGETNLKIADLTNQKTHTTNHDAADIYDLITRFEAEREKTLITLRHISDQDLEKAAIHPRLGTPMKLIDLAFFVAEHDDHHLAHITALGFKK